MRICGIIAEYDPFHQGHCFQLHEARRLAKADYVVCVISTAFSQRGLPALFSTHTRAEMALRCGADLVLGLPVDYSCAQANRFALGGIGILHALGVVNHLSFGIEKDVLPLLSQAAGLLSRPTEAFQKALDESLNRGESFARARGRALASSLDGGDGKIFDRPNFNLGICYLQSLKALDSEMSVLPVIRRGDYHDTRNSPYPSASAMRAAILRGDWAAVSGGLPPDSLLLVEAMAQARRLHLPEALDMVLLSRLLESPDLSGFDEISEGLDRRILKYARQAVSRKHLIRLVKTKRYPYARISRALTHCLLGIKKQALRPPGYARILGMRKEAAPLLEQIGQHGFPLITRPAKADHPGVARDMRAEELWYMGAGRPAAEAWQQKVISI